MILMALLLPQTLTAATSPTYPENARNTEKDKNGPMPALEALAGMRVPPGFRVSLFAAEPQVAQPVSMNFDDRGRLWVSECFSYESSGGPWNQPIRDRITCLCAHGGLAGMPAVSIPGALADGAPVGLLIVGGPGTDATLVHVARAMA